MHIQFEVRNDVSKRHVVGPSTISSISGTTAGGYVPAAAGALAYGEGVVARGQTLRSLGVRSYRLYFLGQLASLCGTWMQMVALAWLVLDLTDSGTHVGLVATTQFVPVLLLGASAGVLIDRLDRRHAVIGAELVLLVQATALAALVLTHTAELWMIYGLALVQGVGTALEQPGRQALLGELVTEDDLPNALSLNGALFTMSRVVGPAVAAVLISVAGVGLCFVINALSFLAIIVALAAIRPADLLVRPRVVRARGQLREGIAYVVRTPTMRPLFLSTALLTLFGQSMNVVLPVLAREAFDGGAGIFGTMAAVTSAGACIAAFWMASAPPPTDRRIMAFGALLAVSLLATAASPNLAVVFLVLPLLGYAQLGGSVSTNTANQLRSPPDMRGRTIALYFSVAAGANAVGSVVMGALSDAVGPRLALALGGLVCLGVTAAWLVHLGQVAAGDSGHENEYMKKST
jgi:MFS family permease